MKPSKRTAAAPAAAPATAPSASPAVSLPPPRPDELRISVERRPYAEIIGHAVVEPDVEVCGVLVGRLLEDAHGKVVHVTAAIRGEAAREQGAAVTFTHETWNHIHGEMDRRFPEDQIVGWYHTHGGFGVFLSEMDTFVHDNFFQEPHHVAYVYDPLAGSEAFFHRQGKTLQPAPRYWLGGRERRPAMQQPEASPGPQAAAPPPVATSAASAQLERAALALEAAADARGSFSSMAPWAVAAAAVALLFLGDRAGFGGAGRGAAAGAPTGPVAVLEVDPMTGRAVGIPIELLEVVDGGALRDAQGTLRAPVLLRAPDGSPALQPGLLSRLSRPPRSEAELAAEKATAERAEQDRSALGRVLAWGAGGALLLAALLAAGWYFLARR